MPDSGIIWTNYDLVIVESLLDYAAVRNVQVHIYDDRLVVRNPRHFPGTSLLNNFTESMRRALVIGFLHALSIAPGSSNNGEQESSAWCARLGYVACHDWSSFMKAVY